MKKIKYLTPILGLSAMVGVAAPVITSCSKTTTEESTIVPTNLLRIGGTTLFGFVEGTDLSKYDTLVVPEGVEYIAPEAFLQLEENAESETDLTMITTLKLPASLRHVYSLAFAGLTNLKKIDLTSWDVDTISFIEFADELAGEDQYEAFAPEFINNIKSCYVQLPAGLPAISEKEAKTKLNTAGIPDWWFVEQTTGHIAATPDKEQTQNAIQDSTTTDTLVGSYAPANNYLTLAEVFDTEKYELEIHAEVNERTDDDNDRMLVLDELMQLGSDNKTITLPVRFFAEEQEDDEIMYDLNVICRKVEDSSVVWTEKVTDFKLKYVYTHVDSIALAEGEKSFTVDLKDNIYTKVDPSVKEMTAPTVLPANACNPAYTWSSSDEKVATVDQTGKVSGKGFGQANITVTTEDGAKTDSATVSIDTAMIGEDDDNFESAAYAVNAGSTVTFLSWTMNGEPTSGALTELYDNTSEKRTFSVVNTDSETYKFLPENIEIKTLVKIDEQWEYVTLVPNVDYTYNATDGVITFEPYDETYDTGVYLQKGSELKFTFTFDKDTTSAQIKYATAA